MEHGEVGAIRFEGENSTGSKRTGIERGSIKGITVQQKACVWEFPFTGGEGVENSEICTIGIDGKDRSLTRTSAGFRHTVKPAFREHQFAERITTVGTF